MPAIVRPAHPGRVLFAANLKAARKQAGLSQEALAHKAGLDRSYVVEVETGKISPTVDRVLDLAAALQVSAAVFFADL